MNKTSTKTLITLLIVLISFIFIVEFTSPIQSINIGHLQKRQDPAPSPDNPPPKDNPPPPKDNPSPPPKDNPSPPPKENPPQESPPPPKDNPSPAPQPAPDTTPNPNTTPAPDPNATPSPSSSPPAPDPNATPTPDPNATPAPSSSPSPPAPNPNVTSTPVPNAPTTNPTTTVVSDTTSNTVSPIIDSPVVTSPNGTTNAGPSSSPITGISSVSTSVSTTSYLPGREPCTKVDDPRCGRGTTDPTVVSTTEENEIITQPSTTAPAPTKSQSQLAPNPKKSTITQFTTYTTTSTLYFPGYSTVTSSKGKDGELTTYATYIPPSTVVVVKKVTSAKVEEIQETNPSSAGHLDLELSVYNLYSVATSLSVIAVTMLYLIVA